jgi:hypothetical protein
MTLEIAYPLDARKHKALTSRYPTLIAKARAAGIHLAPSGEFTGAATGQLTIAPSQVLIHVTDKPWIVSEARIRKGLTEMLDEITTPISVTPESRA